MAALAWPSLLLIVSTSTPARISVLACVCLRAWKQTNGSLYCRQTRLQSLLRLSGERRSPSMVEKTRVGWPPCPSAKRNSICRLRCSRSIETASAGKPMLRRPRRVFGGFTLRPALVSSKDRSTRSTPRSRSMSDHCRASSSPRLKPVASAIDAIGWRTWPKRPSRTVLT